LDKFGSVSGGTRSCIDVHHCLFFVFRLGTGGIYAFRSFLSSFVELGREAFRRFLRSVLAGVSFGGLRVLVLQGGLFQVWSSFCILS